MLKPYLGWSPSPTSIRKKLLTLILLPVCLWWLSRTVCFHLHPTNVSYNPLQILNSRQCLWNHHILLQPSRKTETKIHQMLLTPHTVAWPYFWDISTSTDCWPCPTLMRWSFVKRKSRLLNTIGCLQSARMMYGMTLSHTPELWLSHSQRTSAQAEHFLQSTYVDDPVPSSLQHLMACLLQVPACHKSFMNLYWLKLSSSQKYWFI